MSYEETAMLDDDAEETPSPAEETPARNRRRIDAVSAVAGGLLIAIAGLALADRVWADIDPVLVAGGAIVAVGVAMIAVLIPRSRRRRDQADD